MKKTLQILGVTFILVGIAYIGLSVFVNQKIESALKEQEDILKYSDYSFSLLKGNFSMDSISFQAKQQRVSSPKISIKGVSYLDYLLHKTITISSLQIQVPDLELQKTEGSQQKDSSNSQNEFDKKIHIDKIEIHSGKLTYLASAEKLLEVDDYDLKLNNIDLTAASLAQTLPFNYESFDLKTSLLRYSLNKLQTLKVDSISLNEKDLRVENLHIAPNYSRENYVKVLKHEDDLMDVVMKTIVIPNYTLDLEKEKKEFSTTKLVLDQINAQIYRDKRVADDPTEKKLYSRMLRELPFTLTIDTLQIKNSDLTYEEVQEKTEKTGKVFFTKLNATALNVTNKDMKKKGFPQTVVDIQTQFMGAAPLATQWYFYVNNLNDNFRIKGHSENMPPKTFNNFFEPAFNMKAEGEDVERLTFDFYGDGKTAQGEFLMLYDDLSVQVVQEEDADEKRGFLSFIANIFVKHQNKTETSNDETVEVSDVERDPTRSFWNYFWNCIKAGLKETLI